MPYREETDSDDDDGTPWPNHAAAALIAAIDDVSDLAEFRPRPAQVHRPLGALLAAYTDPDQGREARELIATWRALDDLAAAVQAGRRPDMAGRRVSVKIDADPAPFVRGPATAALAAKGFARELESADAKMNGLVQAGLALAPAMVPLGAAAIPAIAGLTAELGAARRGQGVAALAFHGIGDALDAVNAYHLDPTEKNLEAMNTALAGIGPAGAEFVTFLDSLRPRLEELQALARAGMFPGLEDGIRSLLGLMPELETLVSSVATEMGKLASEAGKDLAGPELAGVLRLHLTRGRADPLGARSHAGQRHRGAGEHGDRIRATVE